MLKRAAAIVLSVTFLSLAIAPETLACHRNRRNSSFRTTTSYYSPSAYRGVAGARYYSQPYYGSTYSQPYYGTTYSQPYYGSTYSRSYYGNSYSQPYYGRSAGTRYYGQQYYGNRSGYGQSYYRGRNSTRNLALTIGAPAALGAGIGAIAGGGKGAGIGALVGGGGGALYYLLKNRNRRR